MSLYVCPKCGCIENTAVGHYWIENREEICCSECHTGKWHGLFPKQAFKDSEYIESANGYLYLEDEFNRNPNLKRKEKSGGAGD